MMMRAGFLVLGLFFSNILIGISVQAKTICSTVSELDKVDATQYYLFYLHGKIVEDLGPGANHPRFGVYDYHKIVATLAQKGFVVVSEVRSKNTHPWDYAQKVVQQIKILLSKGVPPAQITVVGASKGAGITVLISHLLKHKEIRLVLLAICSPQMMDYWQKNDICLWGHVLSLYDFKDTLAGSCQAFYATCREKGLQEFREIELKIGSGHGFLYQPLAEWIDPTVAWAKGQQK